MNFGFYEIKFIIIKCSALLYIFILLYFFGFQQINLDNLPIEIYNISRNNETIIYLKKI